MSRHIIGDERTRGSSGCDNRMSVEAVLWIVRTDSPWRDLPEAFSEWNSVFRRFSRWSHKGIWWCIFAAMSDDPDFEYLIVDSTIFRAHQHASCAKKGLKIKALGRSRGGLSTKTHMAVRGLGCPVRFALEAGQKSDAPQADALIEDLRAQVVLADAAYDSDRLRKAMPTRGLSRSYRTTPPEPENTRSTSTSTPTGISSSAASQSSSSSVASQHALRKPLATTSQ